MSNKIPFWLTIGAIIAIVFELIGVGGFILDVLQSPEQLARLPLDQQLLRAATPSWIFIAYAVAVFAGLAGALGLLLRRNWCIPMLGLSLLAVVVQFGSLNFLPRLHRLVQPQTTMVGLIVFMICAAIYLLAFQAQRRGWLR